MIAIEYLLLAGGSLLLLSVIASRASGRLGIPALLLFLGLGMLAGSEGPGGIHFDDADLAQRLGVVALAFILFSGGLDTNWKTVRTVLPEGITLSTVGVLATALLVGGFAAIVLNFPVAEAILLGAIVSSTDAAAVFSVLRSRGARLRAPIARLLELESGSNDPMAVFLTVGMIQLIQDPAASPIRLMPLFLQQMALGALAGYVLGRLTVEIANRIQLQYEGLYPVLTTAMVALGYGATTAVGGNGFLAVYAAGLVVGNSTIIHRATLLRFHDGAAWLMQIAMFLALGLLVFPSRLVKVALVGLAISAFLMLVARPVAVALCLLPMRQDLRSLVLVSWVGLRGAVPIILATFPLLAGTPRADLIFDLVFFIVLTSVLAQGTTLPALAHRLGLREPIEARAAVPTEPQRYRGEVVELTIPHTSPLVGRRIVEARLPPDVVILFVRRGETVIVPAGGTRLQAGDIASLVVGDGGVERARRAVEEPKVRDDRESAP